MAQLRDQIVGLSKAARYKPNERRTRADGSVWEGRRGGPPVMVQGPKRAEGAWRKAKTEPDTHWERERWRELEHHRFKARHHKQETKRFKTWLGEIENMDPGESHEKHTKGVAAVRAALAAHQKAHDAHKAGMKTVGTDAHDWAGAQAASHEALGAERVRALNWAEDSRRGARRARGEDA